MHRAANRPFILFSVILIGTLSLLSVPGCARPVAPPASSSVPHPQGAATAPDHLPLTFAANAGQADPSVRFLAHGAGFSLALAPDALTLSLAPTTSLRFTFPNANPAPAIVATEPLSERVNSFIGNDPSRWLENIPTTARVRYTDLYPGIDLTVYGREGGDWEYDVIVAPGADPAAFALAIGGAASMTADDTSGDLVLHTASGDLRQHAPVLYQEVDRQRHIVAGSYALRTDGTIGFAVGAYDDRLPLVIDPTLAYSTYLGGSGYDQGNAIAVDTGGNVYVTGFTAGATFPITNGSTFSGGVYDAFVTKINPTGARVYSTYLGGNDLEFGYGVAVDTNGNAFVTGLTKSSNFPVTNGSTLGGSEDAFVTKLDGSGARVYSTYLGGSNVDYGTAIMVDAGGNAYVTGYSRSANFPVTNSSALGGYSDTFVTKLDGSGTRLYGTYLGGSGQEIGNGIAVDASGNAYVTGYTTSANFPVTNGSAYGGGNDAFVTKLDTSGTRLYSTYLGGNGDEQGNGIAVDASGNAYVTGVTTSANFPVTNGSAYGGFSDAFVTKLDGNGARAYSTYLGGFDTDQGNGIAVDASGNASITGSTRSANFPTSSGSAPNGAFNAFVTKLDRTGVRTYSTVFGGGSDDQGNGIAVDAGGNAYVTGYTTSTNFPVTNGSTYGGNTDAFVTKIAGPAVFPNPLPSPQPAPAPSGQPAPLPRAQSTVPASGAPSPLPSRRP